MRESENSDGFLRKNSLELNPVEGLWKWLKEDVVYNLFFQKYFIIQFNLYSDLIFWNEDELTPEQIVEQALSYKPILL